MSPFESVTQHNSSLGDYLLVGASTKRNLGWSFVGLAQTWEVGAGTSTVFAQTIWALRMHTF